MKKIFIKNLVTIICINVMSVMASAQEAKTIEQAYQTFEQQPNLKYGMASLTVIDAKTGKVVFSKNGETGLPTASTLKVITSATALDLLGPNFTFKTKLYYTGEIDSLGTLRGNIVIEGGGDPTLASARFPEINEESLLNKWVYAIQNAGIQCIEGSIIGDDRYFNGNTVPGGWTWTDIGNYYGAGTSGLNWRENSVGLNFKAGSRPGDKTEITSLTVDSSYLNIYNEAITGPKGTGDNVYAYSAPYSTKIYARGTYGIDLKKTIEISVPDPAYDAAYQLQKALRRINILTENEPMTGKQIDELGMTLDIHRVELDVHESPKLTDVIHWFNQKSINLYGETLLRTIGMYSGQKADTEGAAEMVKKFWKAKLNIPEGELNFVDGSGLSPQNRVTTAAMTKIMNYARTRSWYDAFYKSLPTYNGMKMKSGTIGGALGYTGYQKSAAGQEYTFSLLVNNFEGSGSKMRETMFSLLNTLK